MVPVIIIGIGIKEDGFWSGRNYGGRRDSRDRRAGNRYVDRSENGLEKVCL